MTGLGNSPLRDLTDLRPVMFLPDDDLTGEVLVPAFQRASAVDCMMGFFSSASLAALAPGLATFLNLTEGKLRLVASPILSHDDQDAIERGLADRAAKAEEAFERLVISEDRIARHAIDCLALLLAAGRIEIKIAVMRRGMFHPKVWLFRDRASAHLAVHGSSNMTASGIGVNYEQVSVAKSWVDATQAFVAERFERQFTRLWEDGDEHCVVMEASKALRERIVSAGRPNFAPRELDLRELYDRAVSARSTASPVPVRTGFAIPTGLRYEDGPFAHQGAAVAAWLAAGHRGILEMATGSGKTITSMVAAHALVETVGPVLIVVAAPYLPLIDQWCGEIEPFGLQPTNLGALQGAAARSAALSKVARRLKHGISRAEAVVVSHDTLCTPEFAEATRRLGVPLLLIADEAHNLGRASFISNSPDHFGYRLALSATPIRQYDEEGTAALMAFFGDVVFRFTLEEAIGRCLVEYDYWLHATELGEDEMDAWYDLTARIKSNAWRAENGQPDDYLAKLFRDRRLLLETSGGKLAALDRALSHLDPRTARHTLVYASDKAPTQLEEVNALLRRRGFTFHQLTAEETRDRGRTRAIIEGFQSGEIQVLTAKRVLDEGVNIPQIRRAYVLASTTVGRQWVQRRGRLLRTCSAIGKTSADIHDFLALPPGLDSRSLDDEARDLVKSELRRVQEFGALARNAGADGGPLALTAKLVAAAFG